MLRQDVALKTIEVSQSHEYFFAICSRKAHTFVMIGVKDNDTREFHHLFSVGKFLALQKDTSILGLYFEMLFSAAPARLRMETDFYRDTTVGEFHPDIPFEFSYKAYTFSEPQYRAFLRHIGGCDAKSNYIFAFQRIYSIDDESNKAVFQYRPIMQDDSNKPLFNTSASFNNTSNTCRTTAIGMTLDATNMEAKDEAISNNFLSGLPYSGRLENGKLNKNFLVFPLPPQSDGLDVNINAILKIVYAQLETIPKKCDENVDTYLKFESVKDLYNKLVEHKKDSIDAYARIISRWENTNRYLIDAQRGFSLYGRTATRTMLDELRQFIYSPDATSRQAKYI